jgi:hypothetical protein
MERYGKATVFELGWLYAYIEAECSHLYDPDKMTPDGKEAKWRKDVSAKHRKIIVHAVRTDVSRPSHRQAGH